MEEKNLTIEQEQEIREKALQLKEEKKLRKIFPIVIWGDEQRGEKEYYVAYLTEPNLGHFSKFMKASKNNDVIAMRALAVDCFVDGDKALIEDESLFMFGLMSELSEIITTRQSTLINL